MGGISWGRGPEKSWELKQGPRASEDIEEPTREGGGAEPVERGSGAATLPQALQSGIVHYPPIPPRGAGRKGRHQAERAPTKGTGDRWTQDTLRMQGDKALNDMRQNGKKNKEKNQG